MYQIRAGIIKAIMTKYFAKLTGEFELTQECEANNEAEAKEIFIANGGTEVESTATSLLEIISIEKVEN